MAGDRFACPGILIFFGSFFLWQMAPNQGKLDKKQDDLVDALFIEGDDVDEDVTKCEATGGTIDRTCEKAQAEYWATGSAEGENRTASEKKGGTDQDIYLYSVSNPEDVVQGMQPRMLTIGPFHVKKQLTDRNVTSFKDGTAYYTLGAKFTWQDDVPYPHEGTSLYELLKEEIVWPNLFYAVVLDRGIEPIILGQVAGVYYQNIPDATASTLKTNLGGAGSLDDAEIDLVWNGILMGGSIPAIGGTLATITSSWEPSKQMVVLNHIVESAQAMFDLALNKMYGTGAAAPLFVKMTAAEALSWDGAVKREPLSKAAIGAPLCINTTSKAKGSRMTGVQIGPQHKEKSFRWIVQDFGMKQFCNFDPDCMKQETYKAAVKADKNALDQCDPDDTCKPLKVEGYQGVGALPAPLFGLEPGTEDFGEGKVLDIYAFKLAKIRFRNTGPKTWHGPNDVKFNRWALEAIHDRRENCDKKVVEGDSRGFDCDSPVKTWSANLWLAPAALPPVFYSFVGFAVPEESMYMTDGSDKKYNPDTGYMLGSKGSVILTELADTPLMTTGMSKTDENGEEYLFDPAKEVVFLNPVPVDPRVYLDAEQHTGFLIRASKPLQMNVLLRKGSLLFPKVNDVLIPAYVLHEHAELPPSLRRIVRLLQGAVKAEVGGMLNMMMGIGGILLITGILLCAWRATVGAPRKQKSDAGVLYC